MQSAQKSMAYRRLQQTHSLILQASIIVLKRIYYSKDALINSSCRRRPASIALIYMDPGLRRDDDGTGIAQLHQITVQLPDTAPLLAMPPGLAKQPAGQGQLIIIQLGWTFTGGIKWFNHPTVQILANRIAAQAGSSGYLSNRHPITEMPSSDYT